jgi:hypothetical protein
VNDPENKGHGDDEAPVTGDDEAPVTGDDEAPVTGDDEAPTGQSDQGDDAAPAWSTSSWTGWKPTAPGTAGWTPPEVHETQEPEPEFQSAVESAPEFEPNSEAEIEPAVEAAVEPADDGPFVEPEPEPVIETPIPPTVNPTAPTWGATPPPVAPVEPEPVQWTPQPPAAPAAHTPPPPAPPSPPVMPTGGSRFREPESESQSPQQSARQQARQRRTFNLAPLTVADILDQTFQLLKANWKQISLATLVYAVPAGLVSALVYIVGGSGSGTFADFGSLAGIGGAADELSSDAQAIVDISGIVLLLFFVLLQPFVQGAVVRLVASSYLGRDMTAGEALKGVRKLWPSFVGVAILTALITFSGIFGLIIGIVFTWTLCTAANPIVAIEEEGAINAIGRSWALMKTRLFTYTGTRILVLVITQILAIALYIIPSEIAGLLDGAGVAAVGWFIETLAAVVVQLVVFPITAIAATLIYFDSRVRNEAFDLQFMAARLPEPTNERPNA